MKFQSSLNNLFFFFFLALIFLFGNRWRKRSQKVPPGPLKLPFIGNLHNLKGSLQHHVLTDLSKKYGPLIHLQLGEMKAIVVSSSRLAKDITKTYDLCFADRPDLLAWTIITYNRLDFVFIPYGDYWRQMRRIFVKELLSPKNVASFRSIREEEFNNMIANVSTQIGKEYDLTSNMLSTTMKIVSRVTFGKVCRDHDTFVDVIQEVFKVGSGFDIVDLYPSYRKILHFVTGTGRKILELRGKLDLIMDEVINEHIQKMADKGGVVEKEEEDITDVLLRIKDSDDLQIPIGFDHIKAIFFDMFSGGTETSTTTVDWAMSEMMRHPRVMAKAKNEIRQAFKGRNKIDEDDIKCLKYIKLVIKETLRLHPPGPLSPRQCREECELDGYKILVGTKVFINVWAIGRDPEYWDEPENFIPERFENNDIDFSGRHFEYLPFGAGRRMCPGSSFGLANVELPLTLLLFHFDWELPNGINFKDLDMTEAVGITTTRKTHLRLVPTSYDSLHSGYVLCDD